MSKNSKIIYLFLTAVFFIFFNGYFSNYIINNNLKLPENPIFNITFIQNQGAAFSLFDGYKTFLITFSVLAIIGILIYTVKHIEKIAVIELLFTSLMISGIFNNMLERIIYGYVRDFIELNFIDFPVFNLSDIFINISVISLVFLILKKEYFKEKS